MFPLQVYLVNRDSISCYEFRRGKPTSTDNPKDASEKCMEHGFGVIRRIHFPTCVCAANYYFDRFGENTHTKAPTVAFSYNNADASAGDSVITIYARVVRHGQESSIGSRRGWTIDYRGTPAAILTWAGQIVRLRVLHIGQL